MYTSCFGSGSGEGERRMPRESTRERREREGGSGVTRTRRTRNTTTHNAASRPPSESVKTHKVRKCGEEQKEGTKKGGLREALGRKQVSARSPAPKARLTGTTLCPRGSPSIPVLGEGTSVDSADGEASVSITGQMGLGARLRQATMRSWCRSSRDS